MALVTYHTYDHQGGGEKVLVAECKLPLLLEAEKLRGSEVKILQHVSTENKKAVKSPLAISGRSVIPETAFREGRLVCIIIISFYRHIFTRLYFS